MDKENRHEKLQLLDVEDSFVNIVGGMGRYQIFIILMSSLISVSIQQSTWAWLKKLMKIKSTPHFLLLGPRMMLC